MQCAVSKSIAEALGGVPQAYDSLLFAPFIRKVDRPFPHDITFLQSGDLNHIHTFLRDFDASRSSWTRQRLDAARGNDILPKRAAASDFLWARYTADPSMTIDKLKLWHDVEEIEKSLTAPAWFVTQYKGDMTPQTAWDQRLGEHRANLLQSHSAKIQELLSFL